MEFLRPVWMAPPAACGIAVMAKASISGRAKTRLVPPLSSGEAADFNTAFLCDVSANLLSAAKQASVAGYMAYGPPGSGDFFKQIMPLEIGLLESWFPNFGDCLFNAIEQLFERGHTGAVVLNSDSPTLPTSLLVETAQVLARPGDRGVMGPSTDGGYYLLGIKHAHRRLFDDIAWSTAHVARQTLERAAEIGLPMHILPAWYDVDDAAALRMLHSELCEQNSFAARLRPQLRPHEATHSAALLRSLLADTDLASRLEGGATAPAAKVPVCSG